MFKRDHQNKVLNYVFPPIGHDYNGYKNQIGTNKLSQGVGLNSQENNT